jgi:hypothetical protein
MKFSLIYITILALLFTLTFTFQVDAFGETVERTFCPNRCSGVGHCVNRTLSDDIQLVYECNCGYTSKHADCDDQVRIPVLWSIVLGVFIIAIFGVTFVLFERCNKAFDSRQKFYSPDSVLAR